MKAGLLLLSGGTSTRMGTAKHLLEHPGGGTWGGHLVQTFSTLFPGAPRLVVGEPLPDCLDLPCLEDPREGPAVALRHWAAAEVPTVDRWWVVACDQVRWTPVRLRAWAEACEAADPAICHWVVALRDGHLQPLGGWLAHSLRPALACATERSVFKLVSALPHLVLPGEGPEWVDVDTPEERLDFEGGR